MLPTVVNLLLCSCDVLKVLQQRNATYNDCIALGERKTTYLHLSSLWTHQKLVGLQHSGICIEWYWTWINSALQ